MVENLDVAIPEGAVTVIVGPNACGKSTLLRALARLLKPTTGQVLLDGRSIHSFPAKEVARRLGLLPQTSIAPDGITVADLVARGRHPHQRIWQQWSAEDERVVIEAMEATRVTELSHRLVDELSGGQRQRVWVAMALAQQTPLLLLDEPTTYLDITPSPTGSTCWSCAASSTGPTARPWSRCCTTSTTPAAADHIIAMKHGQIVTEGRPNEVITAELVEEVFEMPCLIISDPVSGTPLVVPRGRSLR